MATRTELRGFLKQSQRTSELEDTRLPSNLNSTGQPIVEIPVKSRGRKVCVNESLEHSDELVKHMSKLPGYLQRMERGEESVQSNNALNVGVLDWGRLEKWKHGRARGGERSGKCETKVSSVASTSTLGTLPNDSHRCKIDDQMHTCSNLGKGKASRDLKHSVHGVRCTLEPELASRGSLNKLEIATCGGYKSSGKNHEGVNRESASGLLSDMGNSGGSLGMKETQKRESGKHCVEKLDRKEKLIGYSEAGLTPEFSDICILRSRKQSRSTLSGEPQVSLDDNRRVAREVNRSLDFSDGINSSLGPRSQIPRSCPLSFDLGRDSEDMMLPLGGRRHSKTASRIFDQEMGEDESRKNRQPSPSKRFSFSFGRLSRSFTFKEDSSAQPLSSYDDAIKSDSMRFDCSVCPSQSSNPEKQSIHRESRVSPLRRLFDPLLKPKGSENALPSKERSCCSNPKPTNIEVPLEDKNKQDTSRTRALFQLTIRSGIPLFQFVVDDNNSNNRSILGATMKTSDSSFKDDSVQYCTFYSVHEVKKKKSGSWLIHGHKEKQRGFVYNVIGQMRLSNSTSSDIAEQKSPMIAESVLFDGSEQVKGRNEVAAVVIQKKPVEETTVIIPGGIHSIPEKGAPSPLISRWRSGGLCDCGGWDVGCKLHVLSNKTLLHEVNQSFRLFDQEGSERESGPAWEMTELKPGIFSVEFGSFLSHLQAFFVCVTVLTTTVKSSSPFAPPLSPVGRV